MTELTKIKAFLEKVGYEEKKYSLGDWQKGKFPFVTISRQAGAGGHALAKSILSELAKKSEPLYKNWETFDHGLFKKVAEEPGLNVSVRQLMKAEYHSQIQDAIEEILIGLTPQDVVLKKLFEIIRTLSLVGKVVIVGRGGSFLTRDLLSGVHVRLVAPLDVRIARMGEVFKLDREQAKKMTNEQDQARAALVKKFFHADINDPSHYDVVFNSAELSIEVITQIVLKLLDEKMKECKEVLKLSSKT